MPRLPRKPDIWQIGPFAETMAALDYARELGGRETLSLVTGVAGAGKSFCAEVYAERHPDALVVEVPPKLLVRPGLMLRLIAQPLGLALHSNLSGYTAMQRIVAALEQRGAFLILDEADRLTTPVADLIRQISVEAGVPICFLGCPSVEAILARHEPLVHRVGFRFEIRPASLEDLRTFIPRTFTPETLEALHRETRGNLRHIEVLLHQLRELKSDSGLAAITPKVVKRVAERFLLRRAA